MASIFEKKRVERAQRGEGSTAGINSSYQMSPTGSQASYYSATAVNGNGLQSPLSLSVSHNNRETLRDIMLCIE